MTRCDPRVDRPEIIGERAGWRAILIMLVSHCVERLVFLDQTSVYPQMERCYGYARGGRRVVTRWNHRRKRYTLIGAMRLGTMLGMHMWKGAMNRDKWVWWVKTKLIPSLKPSSIIILDNLNLHYDEEGLEALRSAGHVVLFQSRYSPDLNPIEKAWSKLKTLIRGHRPQRAEQLWNAMVCAWDEITADDIEAFFCHCLVDNAWDPQW